eukprot:360999-Chlamydomonas_euryale.AAC.8
MTAQLAGCASPAQVSCQCEGFGRPPMLPHFYKRACSSRDSCASMRARRAASSFSCILLRQAIFTHAQYVPHLLKGPHRPKHQLQQERATLSLKPAWSVNFTPTMPQRRFK